MSYIQIQPCPALRPFVECYWTYRGGRTSPFRVLPDGCADILVDRTQRTFRIIGTMSTARVVPECSDQDLLAVRFRPGGARSLLHLPMAAIANQWLAIDELFNESQSLQAVAQLPPAKMGTHQLEHALFQLLPNVSTRDASALRLARLCMSTRTQSVTALAERLGLSRQHLAREVKRATGLGTKELLRTARLKLVVNQLSRGYAPNEKMAVAAGFYDQAHMLNDFRVLVGLGPSQYAQELFAEKSSISPRLERLITRQSPTP